MDTYSSLLSYMVVGIVAILLFWSFFRNRKNQLVQILILSFSVDILIHCFMKFGLHTSYIYGGHFIFLVPMMFGWLFYSYRNAPKTLSALYIITIFLLMFFGLNNFYRLSEFFDFLNAYYK